MYEVEHGDLRLVLPTLAENSFDACVTDPPYHLTGKTGGKRGFMGKEWDGGDIAFRPETWAHAYRVLKPGAYLLAFGGTRTWHRIAVAIEDAGFEIRDSLMWLYGEGMPHSTATDKAIDEAKGVTHLRPKAGSRILTGNAGISTAEKGGTYSVASGLSANVEVDVTAPYSELAKLWEGFGSNLKPCVEPIICARKPLDGTIAENIEAHGVGALHIDACRGEKGWDCQAHPVTSGGDIASPPAGYVTSEHPDGRWPPNVLLDGYVRELIDMSYGKTKSSKGKPRKSKAPGEGWGMTATGTEYNDSGGVSRYFYCPKAKRGEREAGLDHWPEMSAGEATGRKEGSKGIGPRAGAGRGGGRRNRHATVKPLALMRWLVRLVTPPGGFVLDPFAGSGTTGCACALEGFHFGGVELDEVHTRLAMDRIAYWAKQRSEAA